MKLDRLFADMQLAEMEHNAFKSEASAEKLELAKLAYESALAKEEGASAPKVENVEPAAPVQNAFNAAALELLNTVGVFSEQDKIEIIKNFVDRKLEVAKTKSDEAPEVVKSLTQEVVVAETSAPKIEKIETAAPVQSEAPEVVKPAKQEVVVTETSAPKVEKIETVAPVQSEVSKAEEEKKTV